MAQTKILIADDEPLNLLLFSEMLKSAGHLIIKASDGFEAVEKAVVEIPDLIILDWNMPRLDGLEALKEIKKNNATTEIPVIMITGIMTSPENLKIALEAGAIDFLRKPFDKIELLARVRSMLLLSQSMQELQEKYQVIEQNNKFIHALMESIPHPMVYYSLYGDIKGYNHRFESIFEIDKNTSDIPHIYHYCYNTKNTDHYSLDQELIKTGHDLVYEGIGGKMGRDYIFSKTLFYNFQKEAEGIMCVMTDISDLKQAHHEIMESKKRELTSSALRLIQISEMNNNLISELEEINQHTDKKGRDLIRNTINKFNFSAGENIWQEFEKRFENVYESFYSILNRRFPDLTSGEKKLCALLRLNLSSKEIAAITFQNPQSIDMARYRLRKKMNLSQDESLVDFLMKIN